MESPCTIRKSMTTSLAQWFSLRAPLDEKAPSSISGRSHLRNNFSKIVLVWVNWEKCLEVNFITMVVTVQLILWFETRELINNNWYSFLAHVFFFLRKSQESTV